MMVMRKRGHQTLYGATSRQKMVLKERDNADQLTKKRQLDEAEKLAVHVNGTPTLEAFLEKKKKYQPNNAEHSYFSDYTFFYDILYVHFYYTITIMKLLYKYEILMNLLLAYQNFKNDFYLVEN